MVVSVYVPLLVSLLGTLPVVARGLGAFVEWADPRRAVRLVSGLMMVLAVATTASLVVLVLGGLAELGPDQPAVESGHANPGGLAAGAVAALALVVVTTHAAITVGRNRRRRREVRRVLPASPEQLTVLPDDAVYAVAVPPRGGPGSVVISSGLRALLTSQERTAVVAHEQEHLDGHHHRYLSGVAVLVALNPMLCGLRRELLYGLERCADEAAARVVDRHVVARAVGRTALAARDRAPSPGLVGYGGDGQLPLGAATGPVPRRVQALLRCRPRARAALAGAVPVLLLAGLALIGIADAAEDIAAIATAAGLGVLG